LRLHLQELRLQLLYRWLQLQRQRCGRRLRRKMWLLWLRLRLLRRRRPRRGRPCSGGRERGAGSGDARCGSRAGGTASGGAGRQRGDG
jgi:uncharacterized membrane protein YgcG